MNTAIILSGGTGSRMGTAIPKQYVEVEGRPVLDYCLSTFAAHPAIGTIVIAVADEWRDFVDRLAGRYRAQKPLWLAPAGETRQLSIYNGLKTAAAHGCGGADVVVVHDGARPLVSAALISRCVEACATADAVMPALAVKDTTYMSDDGRTITALLDRGKLRAGQAPEAFRMDKYLKAHDDAGRDALLRVNGSTELAFRAGLRCAIIDGDPMNFKITTPEDLASFRAIAGQAEGATKNKQR